MKYNIQFLQDGDDSDSRSQPRQAGSQYYSQVRLEKSIKLIYYYYCLFVITVTFTNLFLCTLI